MNMNTVVQQAQAIASKLISGLSKAWNMSVVSISHIAGCIDFVACSWNYHNSEHHMSLNFGRWLGSEFHCVRWGYECPKIEGFLTLFWFLLTWARPKLLRASERYWYCFIDLCVVAILPHVWPLDSLFNTSLMTSYFSRNALVCFLILNCDNF